MNVENDHTAETHNGTETISVHSALGDEDEDVHKCGRCQAEFSTLEAFIQHKLRHNCKRPQEGAAKENATADGHVLSVAIKPKDTASEPVKSNSSDESISPLGRGCRKKVISTKITEQSDGTEGSTSDSGENDKPTFKVNNEGRYICHLCEKTFKTSNILRTHMKTHSDQKNFTCQLCDTSFRTKGSLIRHNRRHTDERPYRCTLCGQSFRESGALTRHMKALTPCTKKIRFIQYKEIVVSKDGRQKGVDPDPATADPQQQEVVVVEHHTDQQDKVEAQTVVSMLEAGSPEVVHQVHFTMELDGTTQEQQVVVDDSQAEDLATGDNIICQGIINSAITVGTEEAVVETEQEVEEENKVTSDCPDGDGCVTEIQVKEELVEIEAEEECDGDDLMPSKLHTCPHCNHSFKGLSYYNFHLKGHLGYKPFKCTLCQKDFLTGQLLKKHMDGHLVERKYKCGECGKLYKTVGHVREHMRAHSDERPYRCAKCNKGYKTKNALQVHQRTHGNLKPYVCQFCSSSFREKGSLVRHIRHHTGEKPFKCPQCGRGFAEHGTLNRHLRAKGGCLKVDSGVEQVVVTEEQASVDGLTTAAIISEDPEGVLMEFSSVVADTQEYIINTDTEETVQVEELTLIDDDQNEVGTQIMKVVQRIVSQSQSAGGTGSHQIIVRNATDDEGTSISDCGDTITIATPESLTEQVAMTLASAISDGTLLAAAGAMEAVDGMVTMVTTQEAVDEGGQMVQHQEEYVITSPEEVEILTRVV